MSQEPFMDTYGFEICVGDQLAVAFTVGNSSELRIGVVEKFGTQKNGYSDEPDPIMHMLWDTKRSHWAPEKSKIKRDPYRFLILAGSEECPIEERRQFER